MIERVKGILGGPRWPLWAAAIAALLSLPMLTTGYFLDDTTLRMLMHPEWRWEGGPRGAWDLFRFQSGTDEQARQLLDRGAWPWWTAPGFRLAFFRPLSSLWHTLDFSLFDRWPWVMHAENVALLCGSVLVVWAIYRRRLRAPWAAGLGALFFAVDDAHSFPVVWISSKNALLSLLLGLGAVALHQRAREEGDRRASLLAPLAFALALLAGESALGAFGYLVAYALVVDRSSTSERARSLAPFVAVAAAWAVAYKALGYGAKGGGMYIDPATEPGRFLVALVTRLPELLLGQLFLPPAETWAVMGPKPPLVAVAVGAVVLIAVVWVLYRALRERREAAFFALGMLLSLVPVSATLPNDRLLLFAGLGGFGLIAGLCEQVAEGAAPRWAAALACVVHLGLAAPLLPLRAVGIAGAYRQLVARGAATLPRAPAGTTVVLLNSPDTLLPGYAAGTRRLEGAVEEGSLRLLCVVIVGDEIVERVDDHTLDVTAEAGLFLDPFSPLFRSPSLPLEPGDVRQVKGMTAEVTEVLPDGRPRRIRFRFDRPLDDPSLVWTRWTKDGFAPSPPPRAGEKQRLPPIDYTAALGGKG